MTPLTIALLATILTLAAYTRTLRQDRWDAYCDIDDLLHLIANETPHLLPTAEQRTESTWRNHLQPTYNNPPETP